jgi:hypothetical protein
MIRKLGKLARRNSLAGITSLFKDKKDKDEDTSPDAPASSTPKKAKKDKKTGKALASEASVSHVTAELDRMGSTSDWSAGPEMNGLTPAAKLARQHTLKSNAEAAARAKAQQEAAAAAATYAYSPSSSSSATVNGAGTPITWDKNTTTRQASPVKRGATAKVNEDGTRVLVEEDDSASDEGSGDEHYGHRDRWDEDDEDAVGWGDGDDDDEDLTIRVGLQRTSIRADDDEEEDVLSWAVNVRRSVERVKKPSKGILKGEFFFFKFYSLDRQCSICVQMQARITSSITWWIPRLTELAQTLTTHINHRNSARWHAYLLPIRIISTGCIGIPHIPHHILHQRLQVQHPHSHLYLLTSLQGSTSTFPKRSPHRHRPHPQLAHPPLITPRNPFSITPHSIRPPRLFLCFLHP